MNSGSVIKKFSTNFEKIPLFFLYACPRGMKGFMIRIVCFLIVKNYLKAPTVFSYLLLFYFFISFKTDDFAHFDWLDTILMHEIFAFSGDTSQS